MAAPRPPQKTAAAQKPNSTSPIHTKRFPKNPNPAFHAVFDTMELAEMILGGLCMRDLLISVQRVCKDWKITIDSSHRLQEALFFRPIDDKRLVYRGRSYQEHWAMRFAGSITASISVGSSSPVYEHPLLASKCSKVGKYRYEWYDMPEAAIMGRPEASWRRQLMTQPLLAELDFFKYQDDVHVRCRSRAKSTMGLTLDEFADKFRLRTSSPHERWSWQESHWDSTSAVSMIESARFATYTEGQWVAE